MLEEYEKPVSKSHEEITYGNKISNEDLRDLF